jgi:hypothetical protein
MLFRDRIKNPRTGCSFQEHQKLLLVIGMIRSVFGFKKQMLKNFLIKKDNLCSNFKKCMKIPYIPLPRIVTSDIVDTRCSSGWGPDTPIMPIQTYGMLAKEFSEDFDRRRENAGKLLKGKNEFTKFSRYISRKIIDHFDRKRYKKRYLVLVEEWDPVLETYCFLKFKRSFYEKNPQWHGFFSPHFIYDKETDVKWSDYCESDDDDGFRIDNEEEFLEYQRSRGIISDLDSEGESDSEGAAEPSEGGSETSEVETNFVEEDQESSEELSAEGIM